MIAFPRLRALRGLVVLAGASALAAAVVAAEDKTAPAANWSDGDVGIAQRFDFDAVEPYQSNIYLLPPEVGAPQRYDFAAKAAYAPPVILYADKAAPGAVAPPYAVDPPPPSAPKLAEPANAPKKDAQP
jgi:hypothetical protein